MVCNLAEGEETGRDGSGHRRVFPQRSSVGRRTVRTACLKRIARLIVEQSAALPLLGLRHVVTACCLYDTRAAADVFPMHFPVLVASI